MTIDLDFVELTANIQLAHTNNLALSQAAIVLSTLGSHATVAGLTLK